MILFVTLIFSICLFIVIWFVFLKPLFRYREKLTYKFRESVYPGILEINKTIIAISSAAIVLTIQLSDKPLFEKHYLMISWIGFVVSIGIGAIILLASYTHRITDNVMISQIERLFEEPKKNQQDSQCDEDECSNILKHQGFLSTVLLLLIYLQAISLLISLLSLLLFGVNNVKNQIS